VTDRDQRFAPHVAGASVAVAGHVRHLIEIIEVACRAARTAQTQSHTTTL
jgi:hypothetical protein